MNKGGNNTQRRVRKRRVRNNTPMLPGSMPSPNPNARALMPRYKHTKAGADWIRKYLNPNGEISGSSSQGRVPDGSTKRSGLFNIHSTMTFSSPFEGDIADEPWSMFIVSTNTIFTSNIVLAQSGGQDYVEQTNLDKVLKALHQANFEPNTWVSIIGTKPVMSLYHQIDDEFIGYVNATDKPSYDFIKIRQTYKGSTYRYVGSTLNDQGEVVTAKYPVSIDNGFIPYTTPPATNEVSSCGDVVDSGNNWPSDATPSSTVFAASGYPDYITRYTYLSVPILSAQSLTTADEGAHAGRASDGCYSVNYNVDNRFAWHTVGDFRIVHLTTSFDPSVGSADQDVQGGFRDIVSPFWETGVTVFSGLDASASIQQEYRRGVEYVSAPGGRYQSLQESAPLFDPLPISLSQAVGMTMKSGYPACYNDWGWLWDVVKTAIPTVLGFIPGVGGLLGQAAGPLIEAVENMVSPGKSKPKDVPAPPTRPSRRPNGRPTVWV